MTLETVLRAAERDIRATHEAYEADRRAARCPRLEAIAEKYKLVLPYGMAGIAAFFASLNTPEQHKRKAAILLLRARANRIAGRVSHRLVNDAGNHRRKVMG